MKNVIYARISNDEQTSSIKNQIKLCKMFAEENNLKIDDIYIDMGYSGSNFNRPEFKRLIKDIDEKFISKILVKDLSRIGRNFIETSYYIEEFFNINKVQLIAINDNFNSDLDDEIMLPIKNFINEQYIKECRKKRVKYIESTKNKVLYSNLGVYGYVINNKEILIDSKVAPAIKIIFDMYLEGFNIKSIIQKLISGKYLVPGYRKGSYKVTDEKKYDWKPYMIYRILRTKEYTGVAENLKTVKIKNHRFKNHNPIELINRYPVIISKDKYNIVQIKLNNKQKKDVISKKSDFNFCFIDEFKIILTFFKKELVNEYQKRKSLKMKYFKTIKGLEDKIKYCIENNYDSSFINCYTNQINDLKKCFKREMEEFENFWNSLEILNELELFLLDKYEYEKNKLKIYYKFKI